MDWEDVAVYSRYVYTHSDGDIDVWVTDKRENNIVGQVVSVRCVKLEGHPISGEFRWTIYPAWLKAAT